MAKSKAPESKFAPGQVVRLTDEGLRMYRDDQRAELVYERSKEGYALVRYQDGSEAVYEEAMLEAV